MDAPQGRCAATATAAVRLQPCICFNTSCTTVQRHKQMQQRMQQQMQQQLQSLLQACLTSMAGTRAENEVWGIQDAGTACG
jgi:hypothetical protein